MWFSQVVFRNVLDSGRITRNEQIEMTIVVIVPEPSGETRQGTGDTELYTEITERAVTIVVVQAVFAIQIGNV